MTAFSPGETGVGVISLAAMGWIVWMLVRGLRDARLAIGKGRVDRAERPGAFRALFALYITAALLMAWIGIDLLVGIEV